MALTAKQQAWVDYYKQGHTAADAARLAGYKAKTDETFWAIGSENLRKLKDYIKDRDELLASPRIATMEQVNEFWTKIMQSEDEKTADRLKASELRARAAGAFVERLEHSGEVKVETTLSLRDKMAAIREAAERYGH